MVEGTAGGIGYLAGMWPPDPAKSTIFFIHGAGGSGFFWQAQVEGLAAHANTIALDLPGHGRSGGIGCDRIEDYARSVIDFIKALGVSSPVICGISMGGAVTQQLLLDYPDFIKAGILVNTGAKLKVAPAIFDTLENDYSGYLSMIGKSVASKTTGPELIKRFQGEAARCKPAVALGDFHACNRFDVMQLVGSITLPVLVVSAADDQLTPLKYGEFLENNIPKASRIIVAEAGHILPMEKPEEFNRAIIDFLDRLDL
ncbi:MAG: alpha/beta hydrolase [Desulfobacterales bacterium]|jgi:3-oxoadipate enol-lactonase